MTNQKNAKGIVSWVSKFGFQIDNKDEWYNGNGVASVVNKGDSIEFEYVENEGKQPGTIFRNVLPEDVKVLSFAPSEASTSTSPSGQEIGLRKKLATECVLKAVEILASKDITDVKRVVYKAMAQEYYDIAMEIADEVDSEEQEVEESTN